MKSKTSAYAALCFLTATGSLALAQTPIGRGDTLPPGTSVQQQPNTTGNDIDLVISQGPTGADTVTTDSAAGGNASLPERAIPNGSAGGGSGGGR